MISWLDNLLPSCCSRKRKEEITKSIFKSNQSELSDSSESDSPEEIPEIELNTEEFLNTQKVFKMKGSSNSSVTDDQAKYVSFKGDDSKVPEYNLFDSKRNVAVIAQSPPNSIQGEVVYGNEYVKNSTSPEPFSPLIRAETDPVKLINTLFESKQHAVLNGTTRSNRNSQDFYAESTSSSGLSDSRRNSEAWKQSIQSARQILSKLYYR